MKQSVRTFKKYAGRVEWVVLGLICMYSIISAFGKNGVDITGRRPDYSFDEVYRNTTSGKWQINCLDEATGKVVHPLALSEEVVRRKFEERNCSFSLAPSPR